MRVFLFACVFLLLALPTADGKVYKWVDRDGNIYFTDNMSGIPPEYRNQVEEVEGRINHPPLPQHNREAQGAIPPPPPLEGAPSPISYTVHLLRTGNAVLVEVLLDGFLKSQLLVDTGAEVTMISKELAQQLGLDMDNAAILQLQSVSGAFPAPLTKVKSITVGGATVRDVEVIVHDMPGNHKGLLGMSFLDNFHVSISTEKKEMSLTALSDIPGTKLYDGHPEDWWKHKFRFYRRQIANIETELKRRPSPTSEKNLRYFQMELETLERKASYAAIPQHWRY